MNAALRQRPVRVLRTALVMVFMGLLIVARPAGAATEPEIAAEYAVVVDVDSGEILYDKNMDAAVAPASLTKIFTTIVALETASLDTVITVDDYDLVGEAALGLEPGDEVTLKTLVYGMMLPSGNDAAMAVARGLGQLPGDTPQQSVNRFMERVNNAISSLGLNATHLGNPHGLDQSGHTSSAHDIAAVTLYAFKNDMFRQIIGAPYFQGDGYEMYQVNQLINSYSGLIGGKTGITDNAGYSLVEIAQRDGRTVLTVLLKSTVEEWYTDAATLLDYGFATLASGAPATARPAITLPASMQPDVAVTATPSPVQAPAPEGMSVDRVGNTVAVVRDTTLSASGSSFSWRWPAASALTMVVMLGVALNYPALLGLGSLAWRKRHLVGGSPFGGLALAGVPALTAFRQEPKDRRQQSRRSARTRRREPVMPAPMERSSTASNLGRDWYPPVTSRRPDNPPEGIIALNSAETIGCRAVKLANRGQYHAALDEFNRALRSERDFDLTRCDGFWGMQPAGFVAAARAYVLVDRIRDAKSLLTVVKLSCGSYAEMEKLLIDVVPSVR